MIHYVSGNLLQSAAEVLVNPVNCAGVMGAGLALGFKHAYPALDAPYRAACRAGDLRPGRCWLWRPSPLSGSAIACFPTKRHWREAADYQDISDGLTSLVELLRAENAGSVALPRLGCGLGGLEWRHVRPLIEAAFKSWDGLCFVYGPKG